LILISKSILDQIQDFLSISLNSNCYSKHVMRLPEKFTNLSVDNSLVKNLSGTFIYMMMHVTIFLVTSFIEFASRKLRFMRKLNPCSTKVKKRYNYE
jgi:hypothetical protein